MNKRKGEFSIELDNEKTARALEKQFSSRLLRTQRVDDQNILAFYSERPKRRR
jgi:hypothetical protein